MNDRCCLSLFRLPSGIISTLLVVVGFSVLLPWGCAEVVEEPAKADGDTANLATALEGWTLLRLESPIASPSPYPNDFQRSWTVEAPATADRMQIHFSFGDVEQHYDELRIYNAEGTLIESRDGFFSGWSQTVQGTQARVELITDYSVRRGGFSIDAVQYQVDDEPPLGDWELITLSRTNQISTPHPYSNNFRDKWTYTGPEGTERIRVHFTGFDTERRYDFVYLYDEDGHRVAAYDGNLGDFVSVEVAGSLVTLELVSDYSITKDGFDIFTVEVYRASGGAEEGCRTDADCPDGQACQEVWCITAPCPWMCVPAQPESDVTGPCSRSIPCRDGLECVNVFGGWGSMTCAASTWSTEDVLGGPIETPHPYDNNYNQCWSIEGPEWADAMMVDFADFDTEHNYDFAYVKGLVGEELYRYHGQLGDFESDPLLGASAEVCLETDYSVTRHGFDIPDYQVEGVPYELTPMAYEALSCGYGHETDEGSIRALFDAEGVPIYGYDLRHISDIHCFACPCPTGDAVVVLIRPEHMATALNLGFRPFKLNDNEVVQIDDPTILRVEPRQCLQNAWDQWWLETHEGDDSIMPPEGQRVIEWAEAVHDVTVYSVFTETTLRLVCMACNCPRGDYLHLLVSHDGAEVLREAGIPWVTE